MKRPFINLKVFLAPILLFFVILIMIAYNFRVFSEQDKLNLEIRKVEERIEKNRESLSEIERMEENRKEYLNYSKLSTWIPSFRNSLEVELFVVKRIENLLTRTEGKNRKLMWKIVEGPLKLKMGKLEVTAQFPSYDRFLSFIRKAEEDPPVFIPKSLEIRKDGPCIEVSMNLLFQFRMKDETV